MNCYITIGISCSGKSCWVKTVPNARILESDLMKKDSQRGDRKLMDYLTDVANSTSEDCIIVNTNYGIKAIEYIISKLKHHNPILVIFDISYEQLMENRSQSRRPLRKQTKRKNYFMDWYAKWQNIVPRLKELKYDKIIITDQYFIDNYNSNLNRNNNDNKAALVIQQDVNPEIKERQVP